MPVELLDISISSKSVARVKPPKIVEWTTVKILPDGDFEQVGPRNRRRRIKLVKCVECEGGRPETEFAYFSKEGSGLSAGICVDCWLAVARRQTAWKRQEARTKITALYALVLERAHEYSSAARRAAIVRFASPEWRDRKAISMVYAEAKRLAIETGQPHDVDHFYPLQSSICCGLHVAENLRVIKASDNRSKSNSFPMDNSPALVGMSGPEIRDALGEMVKALD